MHCNSQKQVTAHVPAKQHSSTDVQSSTDANVSRNKTEGCGTGEAKIRHLQKDLDVATWRNKEMNRGQNSTIQDGLHAIADQQKLVAGNLFPTLADPDVHEINWTILEQVKARAETLHSSLRVDDFQRVMQEPSYEQVVVSDDDNSGSFVYLCAGSTQGNYLVQVNGTCFACLTN